MSKENRKIWSFFQSIIFWRSSQNKSSNTAPIAEINNSVNENHLDTNWEFLGDTPKDKVDKDYQKELQNELSNLREQNPLKYRQKILDFTYNYYTTLSERTRKLLLESRLDSSKRDRLLRDCLRKISNSWLRTFEKEIFLTGNVSNNFKDFESRWKEQPYQKNISGELVAFSLKASNSAQDIGLTSKILGDILWSLFLCLYHEISNYLSGGKLTTNLSHCLFKTVTDLTPSMILLWEQTTKQVGTIKQREGKLPKRWQEEKKNEEERLRKLKITGVSAKYNDGPDDPFRAARWKKFQTTPITQTTSNISITQTNSITKEEIKDQMKEILCPEAKVKLTETIIFQGELNVSNQINHQLNQQISSTFADSRLKLSQSLIFHVPVPNKKQ